MMTEFSCLRCGIAPNRLPAVERRLVADLDHCGPCHTTALREDLDSIVVDATALLAALDETAVYIGLPSDLLDTATVTALRVLASLAKEDDHS